MPDLSALAKPLRKRIRALSALHDEALGLVLSRDAASVLTHIVENAGKVLSTEACHVLFTEQGGPALIVGAWWHARRIAPAPLPAWCGPLEREVMKTRRATLFTQVGDRGAPFENGPDSLFVVPLVFGERVVGTLTAVFADPCVMHAREISAFERLAIPASLAIENAKLQLEQARQSEGRRLMLEAARLAASSLQVGEGMHGFAEMCARALQASHCIILSDDEGGDCLRVCASWGLDGLQRLHIGELLRFFPAQEELSRLVFEKRKARVEADLDAVDLGPTEMFLTTLCGARALGVWPLVSQETCTGLVFVMHTTSGMFAPSQIDLIYGVVRQASIFLRNARLIRQLEDRVDRLEAISRLTETVSSTRELSSVFGSVVASTGKFVACDWSGLIIVDREHALMRLSVSTADDGGLSKREITFPLAHTLVQEALAGQGPVLRHDIDDAEGGFEQYLSGRGMKSFMLVPLIVRRETVAALALASRRRRAFESHHEARVRELARHLAMAIENVAMFDEISRMNQHLRKMDAVKSDFLSTVAHELRTPLTIIKGYLYVLLKDPRRFDDAVLDILETVDSQTDLLKELIENLLSLSRLEANKGLMRMHVQEVRLDSLATEICSNFRLAARKKGVLLGADVPVGLSVNADRGMLTRVFYNLVGNALKFTADGRVEIRACRLDDGSVQVEVADTGAGIAPENLERIFERFFHVAGSDGRTPGGTGLGLSIVQQIVRAHGGQVRVLSELGRGSTFIFTLAADPPAQE